MKKRILSLMTLAVLALWPASIANAGSLHKTYFLSDFERIEAGKFPDNSRNGGNSIIPKMNVTIIRSDTYRVEAVFNEEAYADMYDFYVKSGTLYLSVKNSSKKVSPEPSVDVTVRVPKITSLEILGLARVNMSGKFNADTMSVCLSGIGTLSGLQAKVRSMSFDVSGATEMSDLYIEATDRISMDISGAGMITDQKLDTKKLNVDISGGVRFKGIDWSSYSMTLDISGTADIKDAKVSFKKASMDVSGASAIKFDTNAADSVYIDASGGTEVTMNGTCDELSVGSSGASRVDLSNFKCKNVKLDASGASAVKVYVTDTFTYDTSGMAKIDYYGHPARINSKTANVRAH